MTASSGLLDGTGANALSSYGCFVKDIQIDRTISGGHAPYSGTSMAAPHVAGAAALAWSYRPGASMEEVRNAIIWGGDYKSQLADKVQTGRRLNITGMLKALEHPTINVEKLTLSGESGVKIKVKTTPEHMDASQYITISEDPQFSEQGGTTGYYLQQDGVGSNIFEFDSLNPDTTYYYKIIAYGILHNSIEQAVPYSFHTPKLVTQTGTGNISSSGSVYLSGSTADGVIYSTGAQTIILTESGSGRVIATIPLREMTISSSGSWNGIIQAPVQISSATGITVATVNIGVQSIYMIGSPDVSLSLSGSIATISMQVTGTNGTILPVYRSPNILSPFIQIGSCTVTAGLCTFITDHFSLFAVGLPVALTVTPAPIS